MTPSVRLNRLDHATGLQRVPGRPFRGPPGSTKWKPTTPTDGRSTLDVPDGQEEARLRPSPASTS